MTIRLDQVKCPRCGHQRYVSKTWFNPWKIFGWTIRKGRFVSRCTECGNTWTWFPEDEEVVA